MTNQTAPSCLRLCCMETACWAQVRIQSIQLAEAITLGHADTAQNWTWIGGLLFLHVELAISN